jgi:hypothetical protein
MADAHVTLAECALKPASHLSPLSSSVSSSCPHFDIPTPPPALKLDVLAALGLTGGVATNAEWVTAVADAAAFVADAASAWCR